MPVISACYIIWKFTTKNSSLDNEEKIKELEDIENKPSKIKHRKKKKKRILGNYV
jgi:amino acid permease